MKPIHIYLTIGLMTVSLMGIVGLQVRQVRKALALSEENFDASVMDALNQVVRDLEGAEMRTTFVQVSRELDLNPDGLEDGLGSIEEGNLRLTLSPQDSNANYLPSDNGDLSLRFALEDGTGPIRHKKVRIRDSMAIVTEKEAVIRMDSGMWVGGTNAYVLIGEGIENDSLQSSFHFQGHPEMVKIVQRTLDNLSTVNIRVEDRIDSLQVDTLLNIALQDQGIRRAFQFVVLTHGNQALFMSEDGSRSQFFHQNHKIRLFPHMPSEKSYLYVAFPNQSFYALRSIWVEALASLIFVGIILFCFWLTIRTIIRQKELSEMKNDFINNMTHELKTPIATISLAADALNNPRMNASQESISRYTRIIKEENHRMHQQVERVLQAAQFQRKEIQLKKVDLNAHDLVLQAVKSIDLQVQEREGRVDIQLEALDDHLYADQQHVSNMIHNLLDNALKYGGEIPLIQVRTESQKDWFVIEVQDNGQGISKADQTRIFDRFYRVSTGNLHEVKGFGLGLSYVKETVETHGGEVSVQSSPGKGSIFRIQLPLATQTTDEQ